MPLRVTIWNEFRHELKNETVKKLYPNGIHNAVAKSLEQSLGDQVVIRTATLDEPEHGLTQDILDQTDVLTWWGHAAHAEVKDEIVDRVQKRILEGMGLLVMHSGHYSKIFKRMLGTGCGLKWREAGEKERLWCVNPAHPIANDLPEYFELERTEMYGELFDIPEPDQLIFISWFEGGEVFRSGCCWTRGKGKIFYFRPGHETYPIYADENVQKILANGVKYLAPQTGSPYSLAAPNIDKPLEKIANMEDSNPDLH